MKLLRRGIVVLEKTYVSRLLFVPLFLGLFALGLVEAVYEVYLFTVRSHDQRGTIAELHRGGLGVIEHRPVRQALPVRIAGLG